ncbi:HEAT repeat domain-containing protein [Streptomyces sp. NPDC008079]|uniref:HEAT repeat domain-containing protein n=1 Tax=Streptomyces sp. NPDC008079 TaxID=3364806 RepID=UPI0036F06A57
MDLPRELLKRLIEHGELPSGHQELPPGVGPDALKRGSAYRERPAVPVLDVVAGTSGRRLVVLGDPGGGKSTLARYLALTLTQPGAAGPLATLGDIVPVVVEVRSYAEERWRERTFEDFLEHLHQTEGMAPPRAVMESLLAAGRAFVVFDGLDELFDPAVRAETARRIAGFASRYQAARVMVTSRVIGYQRGPLDGADFTHYMLQDLTEREIGEFARRWYTVACPGDPVLAGQLVQRITSAVDHSRPVRELAGNPLLLTILAIIGRRQTLPRDRQGVYRHAVTVLIAHWDQDAKHLVNHGAPEALQILDDDDRHELLRLLARRMQDGQSGIAGNHIHATELEAVFREYFQQYELPPVQIAAATRAMINQLRERNFILSLYGGEVYGFVHRTFLEYLAAADIVHRYTWDREWTPEELVEDIFARRAHDPAWHEVLLLTLGQLSESDAARVIDRLLDLHAHRIGDLDHRMLDLAVQALTEVKKIAKLQPQSNAVVDAIIEMVGYDSEEFAIEPDWPEITPALESFTEYWTGRQRYLRWFHAHGQHLPNSAMACAVAGALYPAPAIPLFFAHESPDPVLRSSAVAALGSRWPDSNGVHSLIAVCAMEDTHEDPRQTALKLLIEHWPDEATRTLLTDRAVNDPDEWPRHTALLGLAEHWPDELTRALLTDRAVNDPHEWPRHVAVGALAEHWPDELTRALLTDRAVNDPHEWPRRTAVGDLARHWPDESRALLADRALHDPHENPRRTVLRALARLWADGESQALLTDRALHDLDERTRGIALGALAAHWPDEDTRALLTDRAVNDPHEWPRQIALRVLAANVDEDSRALLTDRATQDPHERPRQIAVGALAEHWPDEDTRALLTDRAVNDPHEWPRQTALGALVEHWPDEDTRALLTDRAVNDPHEWPRQTALGALVEHWPDEASRALLTDRATQDPHEWPRQIALRVLAANVDEDSRALLTDRATQDPHERPRQIAVGALAEHWPDEDTRALLTDRAVNDPHEWPRQTALGALVEHWPDEDTRALLTDRATQDDAAEARIAAVYTWGRLSLHEPGPCLAAITDASAEVRIKAVQVLAFMWPTHSAVVPILRDHADHAEDEQVRNTADYALRVAAFLASQTGPGSFGSTA